MIQTTVIGSYPKYPPLIGKDFDTKWLVVPENNLDSGWKDKDNLESLQKEAIRWAVREQEEAGLDVVTDGEQKRGNYVLYHCQHLDGFDFVNKEEKIFRDGYVRGLVPVVRGQIKAKEHFLVNDFKFLKSLTDRQIKVTIPGPVTIIDSVKDTFYFDERTLALDLAKAIRAEVLALAEAGCTLVQFDEPVFIRDPQKFFSYGLEALQACFEGINNITKQVHICRGYPKEDVPKTDAARYARIIEALSTIDIDAIAVEDAQEHLDLDIFKKFGSKKIILGVVDIGNPRIETVVEIEDRINEVLKVVPPERLLIAPDCGLLLLKPEVAKAKLSNMVLAAKKVNYQLQQLGHNFNSL
ncbi:MAG TPA: cobalamin-independent methionine synthase II family protein [Candidatus Nanoarchaeia archaeon]|nr:cobalamin-independent methionine synthase II family protein [Candidatus Nanoarchaeia archaeon]